MIVDVLCEKELESIGHLQPAGWSDIISEFRFYINSPFCCTLKAVIDDKIAGLGASIEYGSTAWLAHIIVDKNYRRQGIGYRIVKALLQYLKQRSIETVLLIATELGKPLYEKAGFYTVGEYVYMQKEKPVRNIVTIDHMKRFNITLRSDVYDLDKKVTGENRAWLLEKYLDQSWISIEHDNVTGYYIPNLREGLVIADTSRAGIELLKFKLSTHDKIVLPAENTAGINFLKTHGYSKTNSKGTRMVYGENIFWHPEKIFSRIGGNFG
ncbi:MAG: GNAT family N-acetyltransferase [Calditrichaceae bacterium]